MREKQNKTKNINLTMNTAQELCKGQSTIHVPCESITQFLPVNLHVQSDGHQDLRLGGILMNDSRVVIIKAVIAHIQRSNAERK